MTPSPRSATATSRRRRQRRGHARSPTRRWSRSGLGNRFHHGDTETRRHRESKEKSEAFFSLCLCVSAAPSRLEDSNVRIRDAVIEEEPYNLVPLTDMVFNLLIFFMA